jgi:hypothetical protein
VIWQQDFLSRFLLYCFRICLLVLGAHEHPVRSAHLAETSEGVGWSGVGMVAAPAALAARTSTQT